jgi:hypothetical protein
VLFASREWIAAMVEALNRHPDLARAIAGLGDDAAFVVERDGPAWPRDVAAWARQEGGRVATWKLLPDADDLLELEPAYVLRAPFRIWRGLLQGQDPVQAALSGRVKVDGNLEALVRRSGYRHVMDSALAAVRTEFP